MKIFKVESIREKDDSKFHRNEFIEAENAKEALKKHPYKDYIVKFVQDHEPNYAVGVLNDCDSFGNEGYLSAIEIDKNSIEDDEDYDDENEYGEEDNDNEDEDDEEYDDENEYGEEDNDNEDKDDEDDEDEEDD